MRQGSVDDQPSLGRTLAAGVARIARQSRLTRGQAAALAVCLVGAVGVGYAVQPRATGHGPGDAAPSAAASAASADASRAPAAAAGTAEIVSALERLDGEVAAMNRQLLETIESERRLHRTRPGTASPRDAGGR